MKLNMKRVLLVLCMITCLFSLSACSRKAEEVKAIDPSITGGLEQLANQTLQQFTTMTEEQIDASKEQAEDSDNVILAAGLDAWKGVMDELGSLVSINSTTVELADDGYMITMEATFEQRNLEFKMGVNKDITDYTSISFNPEYTFGEKMEQAFLNMLMGMGTVFAVLILISLLIACFKFIHEWEEKAKAGNKTAELPVIPAKPADVPVVEENLVDDLELVAVITAAIAASENTSADGLVVRSIRRAHTSKWKNA